MPVFETMFLDHYNIQDSTVRLGLLGDLRSIADAPHSEFTDAELATFIWNAALVFNPNVQSWDEVDPLHAHGITLWAAMSITDNRMMKSSKLFPIDSRVGKTDPSVRVKNNVLIKKALREQFEAWLNDAGVAIGDTGILQTDLYRRDALTDGMIPSDTQSFPPSVALQLLAKTTTSVRLQWTQANMTDFYAYNVYYDTNPNIEDVTRRNEQANIGARPDATLISEITDQWDTAVEITELTESTVHWFIIGTQDWNGRVAFSNELIVDLGN